MYYENESDFDEVAWQAQLEKASSNEDFVALLKALPSEKPMSDEEVIQAFKAEGSYRHIANEHDLRGWCRFWFMAEWCLPRDQQIRCTHSLLQEAGYQVHRDGVYPATLTA